MVKVARDSEMAEDKRYNLMVIVPIEECCNRTGKNPTSIRWIDTSKRVDEEPDDGSIINMIFSLHKMRRVRKKK